MDLQSAQRPIEDLLARYVHCIDDNRLEEWPDFFTEDCLYRIISRENAERDLPMTVMYCDSRGMLKDRIQSLREANVYEHQWYRHMVSAVQVVREVEGVFTVHTNYTVFRTTNEGSTTLYNTGKYVDRIVFLEGEPKFMEKSVIFDTTRIPTLLVIPI